MCSRKKKEHHLDMISIHSYSNESVLLGSAYFTVAQCISFSEKISEYFYIYHKRCVQA